jgi:hypothetical protein
VKSGKVLRAYRRVLWQLARAGVPFLPSISGARSRIGLSSQSGGSAAHAYHWHASSEQFARALQRCVVCR